ncbi:hypothetical protein EDD29_5210 [Actinocorallia herbida]|uniref:Uncharacterized protein n=1 Tax=Actinocorallia herbida TaxID=58109 RepID=A0A3N1D241_9ACTN|nr:hypothetical protein [Actinocorallia herbida]ROO87595.1 hypothetical protein EDD29_5210 [Actinocorallia herbida]
MDWLTEAQEGAAARSWAMNDAGLGTDSASQIPRVAWFQVQVTQPVSSDQPLPTQAFPACIDDVMGRLGTLNLQAVQLLLPEGRPGGPTRAIGDHFWPGPPKNRAVFRCVLTEWSLDIIGWLAAFLAEANVQHGVTAPVLLTVNRNA